MSPPLECGVVEGWGCCGVPASQQGAEGHPAGGGTGEGGDTAGGGTHTHTHVGTLGVRRRGGEERERGEMV